MEGLRRGGGGCVVAMAVRRSVAAELRRGGGAEEIKTFKLAKLCPACNITYSQRRNVRQISISTIRLICETRKHVSK